MTGRMRFKSMIAVVRRTGHSSWYVEKGMNAMGKTPKQLGIQSDYKINGGGESFSRAMRLGVVLTDGVQHFPYGLR